MMDSIWKRYHGTIIGILVIIIWMVIFLCVSIFWTWGNPNGCASLEGGQSCFCERIDTSLLIAEPMNTWSNLYYMGAGMIILIYYDLARNEKVKKRNDYIAQKGNEHYHIVYGLLVIWIGIGSFLMHATWRGESGYLDVLAMNMYISGIFVMSMSILFGLKRKNFIILLGITCLTNAILMRYLNSNHMFIFWVALTFINEVFVSLGIHSKIFRNKGARQIRRNTMLLLASLGVFLFAYFIWHFGFIEHPFCDPNSWFQWHSLWHFLTAVSTILIFSYVRTEREIED